MADDYSALSVEKEKRRGKLQKENRDRYARSVETATVQLVRNVKETLKH